MLLRGADAVAEVGEAVVAAALVVELGVGALGDLLEQALVDHALDRAVERARAHRHRAAEKVLDVAHDGVAVLLAAGQRHDDVHRGRRQRQERVGVGLGARAHYDGSRHNMSRAAIEGP